MAAISFALQGINQAETRLNAAAAQLSAGSVGTADSAGIDTVDLSSAMVSLMEARNGLNASVSVAHTAEQMQGSLLSLLA